MQINPNKFFLLLLLFFLSCASTKHEKQSESTRFALMRGNISRAYSYVFSPNFHENKTIRLLRLLERGTVAHYHGKYYQSAMIFEEAKKVSDELYTKSISRKAMSYIINDNSDNYYSLKYEQSQLFPLSAC